MQGYDNDKAIAVYGYSGTGYQSEFEQVQCEKVLAGLRVDGKKAMRL